MKYIRIFSVNKAAAVFLIACLLSFLLPGMAKPNLAMAAEVNIGSCEWLSKEVKVPVELADFSGLAALTFTVTPESPVKVASVTVAQGVYQDIMVDYYIPKNGASANVGVYALDGSLDINTLADIIFTHNKGPSPFKLTVSNITIYDNLGGMSTLSEFDVTIGVNVMYGDLDSSGAVTVKDAVMAMNAVIGDLKLTEYQKDAGNVSRNPGDPPGELTIYDVLLIARYAAGIINKFPVQP